VWIRKPIFYARFAFLPENFREMNFKDLLSISPYQRIDPKHIKEKEEKDFLCKWNKSFRFKKRETKKDFLS
jgi:hypothetical protein